MKKNSSRIIQVLVILLLLNLAAGGALYFFHSQVLSLEAERADLTDKVAYAQSSADRALAEQNEIKATSADRAELLTYLIGQQKEQVAALLDLIEHKGSEVGVTIQTSSVAESSVAVSAAGGASAPTLAVSFSADGTWSQMITFLEAIKSLPYQYSIGRLSLNGGGVPAQAPVAKGKSKPAPLPQWNVVLNLSIVQDPDSATSTPATSTPAR